MGRDYHSGHLPPHMFERQSRKLDMQEAGAGLGHLDIKGQRGFMREMLGNQRDLHICLIGNTRK